MKKTSAGLVVYRIKDGRVEVLIAHMGGPWWAGRDKGAWSIPKGEYNEGQDAIETAKREFTEELGKPVPDGKLLELGSVEQKNNKTVTAWALEADLDVTHVSSNTVSIEWPPRSGKAQEFPEIDKACWFNLAEASEKLIGAQVEFLERLAKHLGVELLAGEPEKPAQGSLF